MASTMKANRKSLGSFDDRAEVGVGTLIVFIAMVLVAAVAAAVLINTSGTLQERAQQTGKEATQEVSSNLRLIAVYGSRTCSPCAAQDIETVKVHVELAAGALPLDLQKLIIRYSDGTNVVNYAYASAASTTAFGLTYIRGTDANQVMRSGDLIELEFDLATSLAERTSVEVLLIPESGTPAIAHFRTPSTYGTGTTVTFR